MIALPVPLIVALLLVFLFVRSVLFEKTTPLLGALLLACAVQSVVVSIVHYYGVTELRLVQPITASVIPALAWVAFLEGGVHQRFQRSDIWHLAAPIVMAGVVTIAPMLIDALLGGLFVGYGLAILLVLHRQRNELAHTRLASGPVPALIWRVIAIALIISAASDALISATLQLGAKDAPGIILSIFSSLALLAIGFLALSPAIALAQDDDQQGQTEPDTGNHDPDIPVTEIMEQLEELVSREKLYLDPDLTLARIARRLGYPLKQVSTAINAVTGENVSRYINKYRIDHACRALDAGENVTNTMLASGFNTKSNFNREFLRITGKTPSQWQQKSSP
ncbi:MULTISPECIES: AraC family transcriptional regulator [Thalassospira]|uniref:AraC family transcriptional regulator n=1 Tax=Thalassospira profundimaris TaxID=502049 RepID=A0A367V8R6_9PROT|nr:MULTISPECIES: AraC family transcriptional regulator [Thalassospira]RCK21419.1 AraC family transcriptional regulator [Thalassospira profundimaris]